MNIYQRMSAITAELQTVAKNLEVETGRGKSYKAVSERDIIDAVKPAEIKHGVYSYPCNREIVAAEMLENETAYNGQITKKTTIFSRIKTTYRFVNIDDPTEYIETVTFAEGIDPQDKGSGKAMTYADKYALMKAYKISTGDDPDQNASDETHYTKNTQNISCTDCGNALKTYVSPNGTRLAPHEIAARNVAKYGRVLCPDCAMTAANKQKQEGTANVE